MNELVEPEQGPDLPAKNERSIGLSEARDILGDAVADVSDEELLRVVDGFYLIATIAYERDDLDE